MIRTFIHVHTSQPYRRGQLSLLQRTAGSGSGSTSTCQLMGSSAGYEILSDSSNLNRVDMRYLIRLPYTAPTVSESHSSFSLVCTVFQHADPRTLSPSPSSPALRIYLPCTCFFVFMHAYRQQQQKCHRVSHCHYLHHLDILLMMKVIELVKVEWSQRRGGSFEVTTR